MPTLKKDSLLESAALLWLAGFFFICFDRLLVLEVHHFKCKLSYLLFLGCAFLQVLAGNVRKDKVFSFFTKAPWIFLTILLIYNLAHIPFSYLAPKSLAYGAWFFFDLALVVFTGKNLWDEGKITPKNLFITLCAVLLLQSIVISIDAIAYYFGHPDGLIGYNQKDLMQYGMPRPHAFSYEPSYIANHLVLCLVSTAILWKENFAHKKWPLALFVFSLFAIFLTTSRSAIVSLLICALGLVVASFYSNKNKVLFFKSLGTLFGAIVLVFAIFSISLPQAKREAYYTKMIVPILQGKDGPGNARYHSIQNGITIGQETHYLGSGQGASHAYWLKFHEGMQGGADLPLAQYGEQTVMSIWGEVFAESGLPGLFLFFSFVASVFFLLVNAIQKHPNLLHIELFFMAVALLLFMINTYGNLARTDVWLWLTILLGLAAYDKRPKVP